MIKKILLVQIFIVLIIGESFSQLNNSMFYKQRYILPDRSEELYLSVDLLFFTKDNEYFNKIADGYTLYGFQFTPYLTYFPAENLRIDAGFYAQKDFGNPDFTEIMPYLTFMFEWGPLKQIFGNLDGSLNHRLIEPLYDFERGLIDRQETGMQSIIDLDHMYLDLWVNWETMIYKGDNLQEEVSGGISFDIDKNWGPHRLSVPLQLVAYHRGGQIDSSPTPLATLQNSAVGLSYTYSFPESSIFAELKSDNYYVYYKDWSPRKNQLAFNDGDGWYLNLSMTTKFDLEVMASYWLGNEYLTIKGGQLYPSVSSTFKFPDFIEQQREFLILRFMHNLHFTEDVTWSTRIEPYYHFANRKWQFSFGFYLNYLTDFYLGKPAKDSFR